MATWEKEFAVKNLTSKYEFNTLEIEYQSSYIEINSFNSNLGAKMKYYMCGKI
jgi:hypothetical protein